MMMMMMMDGSGGGNRQNIHPRKDMGRCGRRYVH